MTHDCILYYIMLFYIILCFFSHTILASCSKYDLRTYRISITLELVSNTESHQNYWIIICILISSPGDSNACSSLRGPVMLYSTTYTKRHYRTLFSTRTLEPHFLKFKSQLCHSLGSNNLIFLCLGFLICKMFLGCQYLFNSIMWRCSVLIYGSP